MLQQQLMLLYCHRSARAAHLDGRRVSDSWYMGVVIHGSGGWMEAGVGWWFVGMQDKARGGWSQDGRCRSACRV